MKQLYSLTLLILVCSINGFSQQNNIPSEQVLYIDFNGTLENMANDNSLQVSNTNVNFENDRNANPIRAGKFGGCGDLSYLNSSSSALNLSTGGSIAFWAKLDLSKGMNPANGQCSTTGRHAFFSKGGDGFNTPPGFYAYTYVNSNIQTIGFGASLNSGSFNTEFTLPYVDSWHHYAFTFTSTNLKVYVDGVLKRDVSISLSFTEANSQQLYIGTLGPKTTPVLGVTYWFPFGGLMDEFRYFNKQLSSTELTNVYQTSNDLLPPSIKSELKLTEGASYDSYPIGKKIKFGSNELVLSSVTGKGSPMSPLSIGKLKATLLNSNQDTIWNNELYNCYISGSNMTDCNSFSFSNDIFSNSVSAVYLNKYLIGLNSSVYFLNTLNGNTIFIKNYLGRTLSTYFLGGFYYIILENYSVYTNRSITLKKLDLNGNEISNISFASSNINNFDFDNVDKLLLTGDSKTYIVDLPTLSFTQLNTSGKACKWVNGSFILSDINYTYRISNTFNYTLISSDQRRISVLNDGSYLLIKANDIKKYTSSHILTQTITGLSDTFVVLPYSNKFYVSESNLSKLYNSNGSLIWSIPTSYFNSIQETSDLDLFLNENQSNSTTLTKVSSSGKIIWRTKYYGNVYDISKTSSGLISCLIRTPSNPIYAYDLIHLLLTPENNICDYEVTTNLKTAYCIPESLYSHGENSIFIGNSKVNINRGLFVFSSSNSSVFWKKDGVKISGFEVYITSSGIYQAIIRQGTCEKSITKNVVVSSAFNPNPPTLSASVNPVCEGESTILTASNCSGSINWTPYISYPNASGNTASVSPNIATTYSATCYISSSPYGNCISNSSTPLTVNITTLPEVIGLAGNSPSNGTYRAQKISSTQNVIVNGLIDYKSKKSIELNPGFKTGSNAVFNAKIVNSCLE